MRLVIPHSPLVSKQVIDWAESARTPVVIQTPSNGISSLGLLYLLEWIRSQPDGEYHHWILDCGSEAALALEAIRQGVKHLRLAQDNLAYPKIETIAGQHGAQIVSEPYSSLDLRFSRNIAADIEAFLALDKGRNPLKMPDK
jgi:hypothetical protein